MKIAVASDDGKKFHRILEEQKVLLFLK